MFCSGRNSKCQGSNKHRDDYREFLKLVVVYLGGDVSRKRIVGGVTAVPFVMRHPGPFQHARFLHKSLCLIKISMMLNALTNNFVPAKKRASVNRMVRLIVLFHAKYFLQGFLPVTGYRIDLVYWRDMIDQLRFARTFASEVMDSIQ